MSTVETRNKLFSFGQYRLYSSLIQENGTKGDDLVSHWINSSNIISSKFMSDYLDRNQREKKIQHYIKELQNILNQIKSLPVNQNQLQIELSSLCNICYITAFSQDVSIWNDDGFLKMMKETLIRVISCQNWTFCYMHEDVEELLIKAIQQTNEDTVLSPLVRLCCLWSVIKCKKDKTEDVIQVAEKCLSCHTIKEIELPPLVLLPLPLLLTGQQYVDDETLLSDMVYLTAGIVYFKSDRQKAKECLQSVVSLHLKPYTMYLIGSVDYYCSNYIEVLTTLITVPSDVSMSDRIKALHCMLFGLALSKLDKHQCAIQKYREALDHDFSFLLPLYHISVEYRHLNMTAAELESLNLLATALEKSKESVVEDEHLFTELISEVCGQLTLCQVLYSLASRCSELKMYDDASQRYLDLITYIRENTTVQISGNMLIVVPRISVIHMEAIHCLHQAKKYKDCLAICDQLLSCLPSKYQNTSLNTSNKSDDESLSHDHSIFGFGDAADMDISEVKCSQDGSKRKRLSSEESIKVDDSGHETLIQLYKADCFAMIGKTEVAIQCLDRCCDRLPFYGDPVTRSNVHQHTKRRRIDSDGDSSSQIDIETISDLLKLASSVYCHVGVDVASKDQYKDALHFLRISLRINPGNLDALYNYALILWTSNRKDAAISWCQGRDIQTVSDSFHLSNILRQKQNKLRSLTGKDFFQEADLVPSNTVTDEALLKLDVLSLNFLKKNNKLH